MQYKNELKKLILITNIYKTIINIIILLLILIFIIKVFFIPKININKNIIIDLNSNYFPNYKASNFFNDYTDKVIVKNNVKPDKEGNYEVIYTLKYLFITITEKQIVSVIYKATPSLTLLGDEEVVICPNTTYEEQGYIAYDKYYGDITDKVKLFYRDNSITYTIKNRNGKEISKIRTIKYEDLEPPTIILKGSNNMIINEGIKYIEPGYTISDNCDSKLESQVQISGTVNEEKIGTYTLTYTITDNSGNTTIATRKVNVVPKNSKESIIYLTFDDGPSATSTPKILDILKEEGVPATFFVINKNNDLNYILLREKNEGHAIGLHTASHNYSKVYASIDAYFEDLNIIHDKVYKITNIDSRIIRFPGGSSNTISKKYTDNIMTNLTKQVQEQGYNYFDWNIDSLDAGTAKTKEDVYTNVISSLQKERSNVILMHDFENNDKTVDALREIIEYGKSNGYTFKKITNNTTPIRHKVNN